MRAGVLLCFLCGCGNNNMAGAPDLGADLPPGPDLSTVANAKRVFVTHGTWSGNLKGTAGTMTGLDGGDSLCNAAASGASLGGTWRAWLSDGTANAIDRINDVGPWYLVDRRTRVLDNKSNLTTQPIANIDRDEDGLITDGQQVWTGTKTGGVADGNDCMGWTVENDATVSGRIGENGLVAEWTSIAGGAGLPHCFMNAAYHLYCLEQ